MSAPGIITGLDPGTLARLRGLSEEVRVLRDTLAGVSVGSGAPSDAAGGFFYLRTDGGTGTTVYHRRSGAWEAIL